jgi:hypothetical protein
MFLIFFIQALLANTLQWPELSKDLNLNVESKHEISGALIVAIEDYVFVSDIEGAQKNAHDWYYWFSKYHGLSVERVSLLENEQATKENILQEAERLAKMDQDGALWFVFIGHGAPDKMGDDGILLGVDVQQNPNSIFSRGLKQSELISILEYQNNEVIGVVDACFSGKSTDGVSLVENLQPLIATQDLHVGTSLIMTAA